MANLRTNNLSGEQGQNAYRGSVQFNDDDYLQIADSADIEFGSNDYTVEFWAIFTKKTSSTDYEEIVNKGYPFQIYRYAHNDLIALAVDSNASSYDINATFGTASRGDWHHIAVSRSGNTTKAFLNGIQGLSSTSSTSIDDTGSAFTIGAYADSLGSYKFRGVISNVRVVIGTALYTADFTPPTEELTIVDGTAILCCQDSNDPTQEATGKTITGFGDLATAGYLETQPKVIPPYGVDAGNTFGGSIQQSTQGYMCFPTGRTEERGRGRGVLFGGYNPSSGPAGVDEIFYLHIQSMGNAIRFSDLSTNSYSGSTTCASSTRALKAGGATGPGSANPNKTNNIEYVTIATQGNSKDFGDMLAATSFNPGGGNQTRGIWMGGEAPGAPGSDAVNTIQFVTIATTGDATDFGDLRAGSSASATGASPTRMLAMGGGNPSSFFAYIDFVEIATTGNASDFGDMSTARNQNTGVSSNTRAVAMGGNSGSGLVNVMEFVTIATLGDATDFGDLSSGTEHTGSVNNSTRGVQVGGRFPSYVNTMEFITIATTGNSSDFGDIPKDSLAYIAGASDSHGGL
tara:strand:+ start:247 stop:1962 length:1716 start_codon:yes stop_codon:yes gene_type:complete